MAENINTSLDDGPMSLSLLKVLTDNSFDSILVTDTKSVILYANEAFKTLTGYDPAEVIGKTPQILQGDATDKKTIGRLASVLQSGDKFEGRAINYRKDGTAFIMHWRVLPVNIGHGDGVWVAIQREGSTI